jgi:hypothetical protein
MVKRRAPIVAVVFAYTAVQDGRMRWTFKGEATLMPKKKVMGHACFVRAEFRTRQQLLQTFEPHWAIPQ